MDIKDCYSSLVSGYSDWQEKLVNRRFHATQQQISWHGNADPRFSGTLGADEFAAMVERAQYSFQFIETGAIARIHYEFDSRGRSVCRASLSYICPPNGIGVWVNPVTGIQEGLCEWLRVDFDPDPHSVRPPNHAACHLHLSGWPDARIPLSRLPAPRQFIAWLITLSDPDTHDDFFKQDAGRETAINAPAFVNEDWSDGLRNWAHFAIPPMKVGNTPHHGMRRQKKK
jgi:hypothetical protein